MDKSLKLLAIVLVVLYLANQASSLGLLTRDRPLKCDEKPKKCVSLYVTIDERLKNEVSTDDVNENMAAIWKWIIEITAESKKRELSRSKITYLTALSTIHDLTQVGRRGQCKITTAIVLQNNDEALRGALSKLEYDVKPTKSRLLMMLKHYRDKFLEHCDFEPRLRSFHLVQLQDIKLVISELIRVHIKGDADGFNLFQSKIVDPGPYVSDNPKQACVFAEKNMKTLKSTVDGEIGGSFLKFALRRDHKDPLVTFDEETSIRQPLKDYIVDPCSDYVTKLDGVFSNKWTRAQSLKRNKKKFKESEFYKHLAYFHGCQKILLNRRDFSEAIAAALGKESNMKNH